MFVNISGLPSNTMHGFHVHEYGDTVTKGEQVCCLATSDKTRGKRVPRSSPFPWRKRSEIELEEFLIDDVTKHYGKLLSSILVATLIWPISLLKCGS